MNYRQSEKILEEVKSVNKILLNCHRGPDQDSLASAFALAKVLEGMGKEVSIFCPTRPYEDFSYIGDFSRIKVIENVDSYDFSGFDLIIILDSAGWRQFGFTDKDSELKVNFINIDHHPNSDIQAAVELIDTNASATCEVLHLLFQDWGVTIDTDLGQTLLFGILGDTGVMRYSSTTPRTLQIAAKMFEAGVDYNAGVFNITQNYDLNLVKWWGLLADRLEIDSENEFVWAAVEYEAFKKYNIAASSTSEFANLIARSIKGTTFCIVMVEKKPKIFSLSVRSRIASFDSSVISQELGGGGHEVASGALIEGEDFESAVKRFLRVARKHAKNFKKD